MISIKLFYKIIFLTVLFSIAANVYSSSRVYFFETMAQSSNIAVVNVVNKQPLFTKAGFSCGYSYSFDIVDSYKNKIGIDAFWSMRDDVENTSYVVFFEKSKYILNNRIENALSKELSQEDEAIINFFRGCEAIIPEYGLSADGSGIFKLIKVQNFDSLIDPKTCLFYFSKSALKSCGFENGYSEKLISLSCFKQLITNG